MVVVKGKDERFWPRTDSGLDPHVQHQMEMKASRGKDVWLMIGTVLSQL